MTLKTEHLNLNDRALNAWMSLREILWKFEIVPQFYEPAIAMHGLTRLQNRKDYEDRSVQ